ncbi:MULTISPECIES: hypothetical protein [Haloarcula]|uniref:Uncharacterized protein n=3 Tax=Haloarcula TaxID=2237 RepID=A0A830EVE0_9EURY|nr:MULTISPECIES: hypothetical protein [Haloarcula]EMA31492.1 hypothetical protein C444_07855 [Haloarcula japonica DSM 6131]GGK79719.1 hypothetical protein GCM10009067_35060 [Haloarcula sebkhae]
MIGELASLVVQTAPFVSIVILELLRPGFNRRLDLVLEEYDEVTLFDERQKTDIERFAAYSFDYENAMEHLELTLLALIVVFVGKLIAANARRTLVLTGILFVVSALVIVAVRYRTRSYFEALSPDRYWVEGQIAGHRYGKLVVVGSNLLVIVLIVVSEVF